MILIAPTRVIDSRVVLKCCVDNAIYTMHLSGMRYVYNMGCHHRLSAAQTAFTQLRRKMRYIHILPPSSLFVLVLGWVHGMTYLSYIVVDGNTEDEDCAEALSNFHRHLYQVYVKSV